MRRRFVGAGKTCCARWNLSSASAKWPARWSLSPSLKSSRAPARSASLTWANAGGVAASHAEANEVMDVKVRRRRRVRMRERSPGRGREPGSAAFGEGLPGAGRADGEGGEAGGGGGEGGAGFAAGRGWPAGGGGRG